MTPERVIEGMPKEQGATDVDPTEVAVAFREIIKELKSGYDGKPRRQPVRIMSIWRVFEGRENERIPVEDFVDHFSHNKDPRKSALSALSWVNRALQRYGFEIERTSSYRLRTKEYD